MCAYQWVNDYSSVVNHCDLLSAIYENLEEWLFDFSGYMFIFLYHSGYCEIGRIDKHFQVCRGVLKSSLNIHE